MSGRTIVPDEVSGLEPFTAAGVLGAAEVHAAAGFARVGGESDPAVVLAAALAVRAPLHGHVCVELAGVRDSAVSSAEGSDGVATDDRPEEPADAASDGAADPDPAGAPGSGPDVAALPWPDPDTWAAALQRSGIVHVVDGGPDPLLGARPQPRRPLVLDGGRLYLTRYWALERYLAADLLRRSSPTGSGDGGSSTGPAGGVEERAVEEVTRLFAAGGPVDPDQLAAALAGVRQDFVVISGGPGTGKTTTVARLLAGLVSAGRTTGVDRRIALVAPTGKAAARMTEAVRQAVQSLGSELDPAVAAELGDLEATTIHRLLGRHVEGGFRHRPGNPLPHDVVIVDEVSMVSLSLMTHLLAAVGERTKVVLVGDPYQLASVEAGAVLGDVVGEGGSHQPGGGGATAGPDGAAPGVPAPLRQVVRTLRTVHRQQGGSGILDLAALVRAGDAAGVREILGSDRPDLSWIDPDEPGAAARLADVRREVTDVAADAVRSARERRIDGALAAISGLKVLCAHRRGADGVEGWNRRVEDHLRRAALIGSEEWYDGRPVMVTENDYLNEVFNGDVGVAVRSDDRFEVWFPRASGDHRVESARLDRIATQWAMSIHKSQGSEFAHVVVSLPGPSSRILTRELLYTAVTRARRRLTVVAPRASIDRAVGRPVVRPSGLTARLARPPGPEAVAGT